jgi:hypothetical protein
MDFASYGGTSTARRRVGARLYKPEIAPFFGDASEFQRGGRRRRAGFTLATEPDEPGTGWLASSVVAGPDADGDTTRTAERLGRGRVQGCLGDAPSAEPDQLFLLPWTCEQHTSARRGGAPASRRPA